MERIKDQADRLRALALAAARVGVVNGRVIMDLDNQPPADYDAFLAERTDEHVRKDHDYGSRFMKGLLELGPSIYFWEAQKKIDRLRTWIERGELKVKGEGIRNSVGDLFNYTVQFEIYRTYKNHNPLQYLTERHFYSCAAHKGPHEWLDYLMQKGLVKPHEEQLRLILLTYMGVAID